MNARIHYSAIVCRPINLHSIVTGILDDFKRRARLESFCNCIDGEAPLSRNDWMMNILGCMSFQKSDEEIIFSEI